MAGGVGMGAWPATVGSNEETLQLIRFSLPDGTYSPWLALSPQRFIEMHSDMRTRIQAALEAQYDM